MVGGGDIEGNDSTEAPRREKEEGGGEAVRMVGVGSQAQVSLRKKKVKREDEREK